MNYDKLISQRAIVSSRIEELLLDDKFELSIDYLKYIHNYLFKDIIVNSGEFRTYNIIRDEEILNNQSVTYADFHTINTYLTYDFNAEQKVDYSNLPLDEVAKNIASLTSRIWQVHPFTNGNTRTVCVFIEKYLKEIGYKVDNHIFNKYSIYFRNALVVSAYFNQELEIHNNLLPLINFYKSILTNQQIEFSSYSLYIIKLFAPEARKHPATRKKIPKKE